MVRNGLLTATEWSQPEIDELLKQGYVNQYEGDYIHDVMRYPELAEDPFNIRFTKKRTNQIRRRRDTEKESSSKNSSSSTSRSQGRTESS